MTDLPPPTAPQTTPPKTPSPPAPPWMKIVLALSLAANLAVVGVVGGAALKFRFGDGPHMRAPRDLAFGPYSEALTREQRRTLFASVVKDGPGLKALRGELRADLDAVLGALRSQPFDAAAFRLALEQQNARLSARVADGRRGLVDVVEGMRDEDRLAFADRLERRLGARRYPD